MDPWTPSALVQSQGKLTLKPYGRQAKLHFCHKRGCPCYVSPFAQSFWHGRGVLVLMKPILIGDPTNNRTKEMQCT